MLDVNENLNRVGEEPIAFEHDCLEGICGSCGALVAGKTHGSHDRTTLCQLHMTLKMEMSLLSSHLELMLSCN